MNARNELVYCNTDSRTQSRWTAGGDIEAVVMREAEEKVEEVVVQGWQGHWNKPLPPLEDEEDDTDLEDEEDEINGMVVEEREKVHMEKNAGTETMKYREDDLDAKLKKLDIQKILRSVIKHQDEESVKHEISCEEEYMLFKLLSKGTKELVNINRLNHKESDEEVEEEDQEVIELEFERAVEMLDQHQHSLHCPNCNSSITKVVLRKRRMGKSVLAATGTNHLGHASELEPVPVLVPEPQPEQPGKVPHEPLDLFGCFSCFRIFPEGSGLDLFPIFKKKPITDEKRSTVIDQRGNISCGIKAIWGRNNPPPPPPPQESVPLGEADDAPNHVASSANIVVDGGSGSGEFTINIEGESDDELPTELGGQTGEIESTEDERPEGTNVQGTHEGTQTDGDASEQKTLGETKGSKRLEIIKSIVYGGLMESITSLSVVSSAAAADATTVNIVAMGLANLIGGLFIIGPNLRELKNEESRQVDRYKELLGQRENFLLHATVAVLAFLIFGLIPPITYGFSFRQSDDKDLKLVVVAAASLVCIAILAIVKAHIQKSKFSMYIQTLLYYVGMAVMASGISYAVGDLIKRLMEKLGWFDSSVAVTLSLPQVQSVNPAWASY